MNIGSVTPTQPANDVQAVTEKRATLQMLLLRKSLEMQQGEAEQSANQAGGKGQIIDLRV